MKDTPRGVLKDSETDFNEFIQGLEHNVTDADVFAREIEE